MFRGSCSLKLFAKFTAKHLSWGPFSSKFTGLDLFTEHTQPTASAHLLLYLEK